MFFSFFLKHKARAIFIIGIFLLCFFTLFSYRIRKGNLRDFDFAISVKVQEAIDKSPRLRLSSLVGDIMEGSTFFASPEVSVVVVLVLTGIWFYDFKKKKIRWMTICIPLAFFFLVMAEIYGKTVVHHPAPPFFMIKNPVTIFPKYYINDEFSYPSGHAARAVFLSVICSYFILHTSYFKRKHLWVVGLGVLCTYVVLVSVSRIYLGHHWLSDIIGGLALGVGLASLTSAFLFRTDS